MRLLIDECLPRGLKRHLTGHECRTVQEMGWSGKQNGDLLELADPEFDVFVTIDQGIPYQQHLASRRIAVLILNAISNKIEDLLPILPAAGVALRDLKPGRVLRLGE